MSRTNRIRAAAVGALVLALFACAVSTPNDLPRNGWWQGDGPVVAHDTFPADCSLCHEGTSWRDLRADFTFDHEAETGVPLVGAHARGRCLRCHNDRGPVEGFMARGCAGCHEDVHVGRVGPDCTKCHDETTWFPTRGIELHASTRFPLVGVHAYTSCRRCHEGAEIGRFVPTDTQCLTCHREDLARANNPNHVALGWVDRCDRCHRPTDWNEAEFE
jgi:hypothetical protein